MSNVSDDIAKNITGQAVDLLRFAEHLQQQIIADLQDLEGELVADIQKALKSGATDFTMARLDALLKQTRDTIDTAYGGIIQDTQAAATKLAQLIASGTVGAVNTAIGASVVSVAVSATKLEKITEDIALFGQITSKYWEAQSAALQDSFAREMRMGQLRGETVEQLVRRVIGTKAQEYTDGIMQSPRYQAQALVRTGVMQTQGAISQAIFQNNRDVVKGIQWLATLDPKTCPICAALDGLEWELPEEGDNYADYIPVGHNKEYTPPPAHWNCRCTIIPVMFSWEELSGEHGNSNAAAIADQVPDDVRASMDGEAAADLSFEDWMASQPESIQDDILGIGRADLWRNGAIDISQLTDVRNNPLSLAALEDKYG